jgi:hypothetical protein
MPVGYLSDGTTVFSNVSLTGTLLAGSVGASTVEGSFSTLTVGTSLKVGGGTAITSVLKGTISVVAMTLAATSSVTTAATVAGLATGDVITVNPPTSGYSLYVTVQPQVSAASTVILQFSNLSTAQVVQAAGSWRYVAIRS